MKYEINIEEYKEVIVHLETLAREHGVYEFLKETTEVLKNMPKVVTNLEAYIPE